MTLTTALGIVICIILGNLIFTLAKEFYERRRKPAPPQPRETPEETAAAMKQNQEEWQAMMVDRMTGRSEYRPPFSEDAPAPAAAATPQPSEVRYEVIDPTGEGFWQVVDISNREPHKKTILNEDGQNVEIHCYTRKDPSKPLVRVVASYTPYMPEAWEEAHNLCHRLNGGQL